MKPFFVLVLCFLKISSSAQQVPSGINFQAVARNSSGQVLSNLPLSVKISLIKPSSSVTYYAETHSIITSQIGLFTLVIGTGTVTAGAFNLVPWSTEEVYVELSLKENNQANYTIVDTSRLLTVPYAFHAGTAVSTVSNRSTKVSAGANVSVTGAGTVADPYVINASGSGASPLSHVISTGNTTDGNIVFQQNDNNFLEIVPSNHNPALGQGSFSMAAKEFPGVNGGGIRSNVVGSFWGYNTTPGGGQKIPGEASYRFAGETHYVTTSSPGITGPSFELHLPDIFTNNGLNVRPFSMYIDKATGLGSANYQMHSFNFKTVADANNDWMTMNLDADNVRMTMMPQAPNATSSIKMFSGKNDYGEILSNSSGLSFNISSGNYNFNSNMYLKGEIFAKTVRGFSDRIDPNFIAHQFGGLAIHRSLLIVGDDENAEKFNISPRNIISYLPLTEFGSIELAGNLKSIGNADLSMQVNTNNNYSTANFNFYNGTNIVGRMSNDGFFSKTIQTEKPSGSAEAGKLKVGKVVSATVTAVTNKYLEIEIDGVPYKLALVQ